MQYSVFFPAPAGGARAYHRSDCALHRRHAGGCAGTALAQSGSQSDPAWDYGRGGAEVPGQPACYMPPLNETHRKEYSLNRPACNQWKLT